jgi:MFS superfamily sulfate permease-like transporter
MGVVDLDDLQVLKNSSKEMGEVAAAIYRGLEKAGLPERLTHELTIMMFQQMGSAALMSAQSEMIAKVFDQFDQMDGDEDE